MFPALVAVRPDLASMIETLEDDHTRLLRAMEAVDTAIIGFEAEPDAAHQEAVHGALVAVSDAFFPHLDAEDAQILPACQRRSRRRRGTGSTRRPSHRSQPTRGDGGRLARGGDPGLAH